MKVLSIAIPSYNSQDYMRNCIECLLPGGEDVEILIVDDGSTDRTGEIADEYTERYPGIVRAIHQENGGHGQAVNAGLAGASGYYFKVVDSDDWVAPDSYRKVLDFLKGTLAGQDTDSAATSGQDAGSAPQPPLDMLICNYVYEKAGAKHKKVIHYHGVLPEGRFFTWKNTKRFGPTQNILMHSVIYRTELLKSFGFELPGHTFYVDNIFVFWPLPYVRTMYYMDEDFYRYYIGRDDQSVNEQVMIGRIDQQIRVNKIMADIFARYEKKLRSKKLRKYMLHYLETITMVTSVLLMKAGTEEAAVKKDNLWDYIAETSPAAYAYMRRNIQGRFSASHNRLIQKITLGGYIIAQKWIGFN